MNQFIKRLLVAVGIIIGVLAIGAIVTILYVAQMSPSVVRQTDPRY